MEMERLGIQPGLITGASIGGLLGGLLAAGLNSARLLSFLRELTPRRLYGRPDSGPALISNRPLERLIEKTVGRITFADLKTPLAVVTVDLVKRKEVIIDEGDLVSALLATSAFPVLLPPVERNGQVLMDGGVLNNIPFDIAHARGASCVIAVDLSNSAPYGLPVESPPASGLLARAMNFAQSQPLWQVVSTVTDIITIQSANARFVVSRPELTIRPDVGTIGLFDFHRLDEAVELGRAAARAVEGELCQLAEEYSGQP
jgi:NTE family protein